MIKHKDLMYYKCRINEEYDVKSFVYVLVSNKFFNELVEELNITLNESEYLVEYKCQCQFKYNNLVYSMTEELEEYNITFTVIINYGASDKFAGFSVNVLPENERIIKELLE